MGRQIKRPSLEAVTPPFFDLEVGHLAKVRATGQPDALWVRVLEIEGDRLMGIVTTSDAANAIGPSLEALGRDDVIEFERRHIFGLY